MTIKEIRKNKLNMSMVQMANMLRITKQGYCLKENGKRKFKPHELFIICKLANVNPLDIETK